MSKKQKLELTWIGKDERPKLEPRILIEDPELSHHADKRYGENDIFDNILIQGDNLLALKALEQDYAGKVKCIYIDPPFNTGQAFEHYEDGLEHSLWLSLMRDRIEQLRLLLSDDGSIWVHLDENEIHYLKVLMDEIFGRANFITTVVWRAGDSSNNDAKQFSLDHNAILVYSKTPGWRSNELPRRDSDNQHYTNPDNDPNGPWFAGNVSSPNPRDNLRYEILTPSGNRISPPANGWRWSQELMTQKIASGEVVFKDNETRILRKTYLKDQSGLSPSSLWSELEETGHNRQAKYELKKLFPEVQTADLFKTPKPEKLLHKIIHISSDPGDIVLDSFGGSGTTAAVAHKMNRKWITIELGDHAKSQIVPRLNKVIHGADAGGVTPVTDWKGGGGYRFYRLAPSLLEKDTYDNWVISKEYDANKLSEAICKLMGFTYHPSDKDYWNHGYSTESDFIFVTTNAMTYEALNALSAELGTERSLMVCCKAFNADPDAFDNLTLKKIPHAVVDQCEWGKDDYSLNVQNLPMFENEESDEELDLFNALEGDDA
jgi:adenine-specific DNA-methyltransferase